VAKKSKRLSVPHYRNVVAWALALGPRKGGVMRDKRMRRAKDARKQRELFQ